MGKTTQKRKKEDKEKDDEKSDKAQTFNSSKAQTPKGKKEKKANNTPKTPAEKRSRTTRNNPDGLIIPTKKPKLAKAKKKLDFESDSADQEFEEDGVEIDLQEGEGFSSSDDNEDQEVGDSSVKD